MLWLFCGNSVINLGDELGLKVWFFGIGGDEYLGSIFVKVLRKGLISFIW